MKILIVALSLLAVSGTCALAQTQTPKQVPKAMTPIAVEPAAQTLLERAIQSYKGATGVSYSVASTLDGKKDMGTTLVRYSSPDKLNVSRQVRKSSSKFLSDGSNLYLVIGTQYYKEGTSPQIVSEMMSSRGTSSQIISALMKGDNPVVALQRTYNQPTYKTQFGTIAAMAPRVVDGDVLSGIQYTYSLSFPIKKNENYSFRDQVTAWFGGSPLMLRRVQTRTTNKGKLLTVSEKIMDQQLSPSFAEDTFKFNDKGLKLASDDDDEDKPYWDARLKVGTSPFPFQAKALNGAPISLDKYKGKVVVMDFWATWCGPCVESLPELKGAYDKYHSQGLEVVGISLDEDKNALTSFVKAKKMAWPQVFDGKGWKASVPTTYGVQAIPFLLVIGKDGKIASVNPRGKIDEAVKKALAAS